MLSKKITKSQNFINYWIFYWNFYKVWKIARSGSRTGFGSVIQNFGSVIQNYGCGRPDIDGFTGSGSTSQGAAVFIWKQQNSKNKSRHRPNSSLTHIQRANTDQVPWHRARLLSPKQKCIILRTIKGTTYVLKVGGNEKQCGSGRSQMLDNSLGPWRWRFIFNLNMQFLSKMSYYRFRL